MDDDDNTRTVPAATYLLTTHKATTTQDLKKRTTDLVRRGWSAGCYWAQEENVCACANMDCEMCSD